MRRCAQQLVEVAAKEDCAVSAVQATHESGRQRFLGNKQVDDSFYFFEVFTPLPHPFDIFLELLCLGDIHSSHEA